MSEYLEASARKMEAKLVAICDELSDYKCRETRVFGTLHKALDYPDDVTIVEMAEMVARKLVDARNRAVDISARVVAGESALPEGMTQAGRADAAELRAEQAEAEVARLRDENAALVKEIGVYVEVSGKPCREMRLQARMDEQVWADDGWSLHRCVTATMHQGQHLLWRGNKCEAVGTREWCDKRLREIVHNERKDTHV